MHICHFCETSVEGSYFENITRGLLLCGVNITLVELGEFKPPTWLGKTPGVQYVNLGVTNKLAYPVAVWKLSRLLREKRIDVLQTHLYYAGLIGVLAKRLSSKTIVALSRHHTGVVRMLGTRLHVGMDKWMAEQADHVVAPSWGTYNYIKDTDKIKNDVDVAYTGFDFEKLTASEADRRRVRAEFGFDDENFVIGYIGNYVRGKGHLQLVEAFGTISREFPNARLFLVGRGRLSEVDNAIERLSLGEKVSFAGWRDDVAACLAAMDLFVQPSLSEAFSQVLVEAMGVGLPVIATQVGGASEVIEEGKNGYLVEPDKPEAIAEKAVLLFRDPQLRSQIALEGKQKVRTNYSYERTSQVQFELYQRWLREK